MYSWYVCLLSYWLFSFMMGFFKHPQHTLSRKGPPTEKNFSRSFHSKSRKRTSSITRNTAFRCVYMVDFTYKCIKTCMVCNDSRDPFVHPWVSRPPPPQTSPSPPPLPPIPSCLSFSIMPMSLKLLSIVTRLQWMPCMLHFLTVPSLHTRGNNFLLPKKVGVKKSFSLSDSDTLPISK